MRALLTNPEVDLLTHYLLAWTENMLKETKTSDYYWLKHGKASRRKFESILKKRPVDLVLLCGHGSANAVEGNGEYILDTNNNELLRGKVVHALSCRSAAELGPYFVAVLRMTQSLPRAKLTIKASVTP